jgi:hypothetical protein
MFLFKIAFVAADSIACQLMPAAVCISTAVNQSRLLRTAELLLLRSTGAHSCPLSTANKRTLLNAALSSSAAARADLEPGVRDSA